MKTIVLRGPMQRQYLNTLLDSLNPSETWECVIRKHDPKRTGEQNDRVWELFTRIGRAIGYSAQDVHDLCCHQFLGYETKLIAGKEVQVLRGTSKLGKKAMADFQTQTEAWAAGLGIDVWERAA